MSETFGLPREALDRARSSRDPRFDGKFFIAVLSTGIYCRPICPVRLSSAVRYYETAAAAAEAGFRPCLRCRPEAAPGSPAWTGTSAVVRRALRLIQDGALDTGSVETLAGRLGVGARHLNRLLAEQVGASPLAIAQTRRLHFAKQLLDETDLPITEIALASGYGSVRRFNSAFKTTYKRPPRLVRKRRGGAETGDTLTLRLAFRPPYDWPAILAQLRCRAIPGLEYVDADSYTRSVRTAAGEAIVSVRPCETIHAVELTVVGALPADLFELASTCRRVFDLAADPMRIAAAFAGAPALAPLIEMRPGLRLAGIWTPFEAAVRALFEERSTSPRAALAKLVASSGKSLRTIRHGSIAYLFPEPAALAAAPPDLLPLEPADAKSLRQLAMDVAERRIGDHDAPEDWIRWLGRHPGFGPTLAQTVALRGFGEPDAFPAGDPILRRHAGSPGPSLSHRALEAMAESWRPWRGYAAAHLWAAAKA